MYVPQQQRDELTSILYEEFKYKNIDEYGGRQTEEYLAKCRKFVEEKFRGLLTLLEKGEKIKELEDGYLGGLEAERKNRLKKKKEDEDKKISIDLTPVLPTEPEKPRRRFFLFRRKEQRHT